MPAAPVIIAKILWQDTNLNYLSDASIRLKMCVNESPFFFFLAYLFFNVQKIYGSILKCLFRAGNMHGSNFNVSSFRIFFCSCTQIHFIA